MLSDEEFMERALVTVSRLMSTLTGCFSERADQERYPPVRYSQHRVYWPDVYTTPQQTPKSAGWLPRLPSMFLLPHAPM